MRTYYLIHMEKQSFTLSFQGGGVNTPFFQKGGSMTRWPPLGTPLTVYTKEPCVKIMNVLTGNIKYKFKYSFTNLFHYYKKLQHKYEKYRFFFKEISVFLKVTTVLL